jgi:hypothetical protein
MRNAHKIWVGNLKGGGHSEEVGVDGKIRETGLKVVDWMHLALVNTVMDLRGPKR